MVGFHSGRAWREARVRGEGVVVVAVEVVVSTTTDGTVLFLSLQITKPTTIVASSINIVINNVFFIKRTVPHNKQKENPKSHCDLGF